MGGLTDRDAKAETVEPYGTPSTMVVMMVTGADTWAIASRKSVSSCSYTNPKLAEVFNRAAVAHCGFVAELGVHAR